MPETPQTSERPEHEYCKAQTESERLRLRTLVVSAYAPHVRASARKLRVPAKCMEDAHQAGTVGLLDALNRFDPGRGAHFWGYAALYVRNEIQAWQDRELFDCKSANRGKAEKYAVRRQGVLERCHYERLGHREPPSTETPERLVSIKEQMGILAEVASEMSPEDRELLFSEDGRNHRTDHYKSLVGKVADRLRGTDGPGRAVHDNSDTVRP